MGFPGRKVLGVYIIHKPYPEPIAITKPSLCLLSQVSFPHNLVFRCLNLAYTGVCVFFPSRIQDLCFVIYTGYHWPETASGSSFWQMAQISITWGTGSKVKSGTVCAYIPAGSLDSIVHYQPEYLAKKADIYDIHLTIGTLPMQHGKDIHKCQLSLDQLSSQVAW
ncbi:hypothetical protein BGX38DRAFT_453299 [Terfezia claveryi]|nr:hypothetical protein BGX38DRAFT_453299 [Terfezia claveryi]